MPFRIKVSLFVLAFLAFLFLMVPLLVPVPPAPNTQPLAVLAGDAEYVTVDGVGLHVQRFPAGGSAAGADQAGDTPANPLAASAGADGSQNTQPLFLLLHDYAFSAYTFEEFAPELVAFGGAVAYDRPGFGLSERPLPTDGAYPVGFDPYTAQAQVRLAVGLLDALGARQAVLVGNGMGGRVALEVALTHPDRVAGLVLLNTPAFLEEGRAAPRWFLNSPHMRRLGPVFLRQLAEQPGEQLLLNAFADQSKVTSDIRAKHALTTSVDSWDRALWEISRVGQPASLEGRVGAVTVPTLVVTGDADANYPLEDAQRLTNELGAGQLVTLSDCGRVPQLECPALLAEVVSDWLQSAGLASRR